MPRTWILLAVLLLGACGPNREGGRVEYAVTAAKNYEQGMARLDDEEWVDAAKLFAFIKARFPYSDFAVLAELRLADVQLGAGAHLEAIDGYRQFIKFHPTHPQVLDGYAAYRIGDAFTRMLPEDWFLVPPSFEKDQSATVDAHRELSQFLRDYPDSPYVDKAKVLRRKCAALLAAHEWYVATFYWKRERPMGTVLRLRTLLKRYPDAGYDEEARWLLGQAYLKVGRPADARTTLRELVDKHPQHRRAADAKRALAAMGGQ